MRVTKREASPQRPVVLVTGGARRIGRALCEAFASDGFDVAVHYRASARDAQSLVADLEARGARAIAIAGDLRETATAAALVATVTERLGPLSVLVSSASLFTPSPLTETSAERLAELADAHHAVHVRAPLLLARAAVPGMRARGEGRILHLTDARSGARRAGFAAYSASKAALLELTRVLAAELAPDVAVNAVAPGAVLPPEDDAAAAERMLEGVPGGRSGSPSDVAAAALFFARAPLFVTGQCVEVDGGED